MPAYHTSSHSGLMVVDPVEANAFRVVVAEDFEGVPVEDGDDGAGEVGKGRRS
jgi:hypothetical protein